MSSRFQRSTHRAMPIPPPMHNVARPFLALRRCISNSSVVRMRAPEAPIGWPMAMAPPLTLTFAVSQPRSLLTAQACAAKASLASTRSRSPTLQPAFLSAAREAGIGRLGRLHQHHGGGAVIDAGGARRGHGAFLVEGRAQLGQRLERDALLR